ncbi:MAG: exodeoxyribonuclease VII large subunit [Archangium sp.]
MSGKQGDLFGDEPSSKKPEEPEKPKNAPPATKPSAKVPAWRRMGPPPPSRSLEGEPVDAPASTGASAQSPSRGATLEARHSTDAEQAERDATDLKLVGAAVESRDATGPKRSGAEEVGASVAKASVSASGLLGANPHVGAAAAQSPSGDVANAPRNGLSRDPLGLSQSGEPPVVRTASKTAAPPAVLTVSQLTRQVKDALEPRFTKVLVRGEISNFRGANTRGHIYFALTDARASIDIRLWASTAAKLKFQLKDGLSVIIEGNLDVYEPQGRYALIADKLEPEGLGAQALRFEQLKEKLVAEGLIGDKRTRPKRPLPFLPRRIGVVTSISGAALRDFLKVLHRRHPGIGVLVADARVQGDGAVFELRRALRWLSKSNVDVVVVTRGGGSADDLWTFNEEPVVRALWACPVPVVCAVGHEIDVTLSDLVADVRAATPSAAAEMLAPSLADLRAELATLRSRTQRAMERVLLRERSALRDQHRRLGDPRRMLASQRLVLSNGADRMRAVLARLSRTERARLSDLRTRLGDPRHELARQRPVLSTSVERMRLALTRRLRRDGTALAQLKQRLEDPRHALARRRETVTGLSMRLRAALERRRSAQRSRLTELERKLREANPQRRLTGARDEVRRLRDAALARMRRLLQREHKRISDATQVLRHNDPRPRLASAHGVLAAQKAALRVHAERVVAEQHRALEVLKARLEALNPQHVLERGFVLARAEQRLIRSVTEVKVGDQLELRFADGTIAVRVVEGGQKS